MRQIAVVGAGTMGAGIAQVAAQAGLQVLLYDVAQAPLEAGIQQIEAGVKRLVGRGRLSNTEGAALMGRIRPITSLADMADADCVIEAVPEALDLKRRIFGELDQVCKTEAILATNTSSLSVTEVAAATRRPERVVGLHFFNPVPVMKLVEVIRGALTSQETASQVQALATELGKVPVMAQDTPGFIVNRIARPFPGEALRLYGEGVASIRQIDRVARLSAGFRMGPFELMDLVGMDVNFAVNTSVFEQYFYEPRFRPHPLQAQMVKAGLLGRKSGAGWYRYEDGAIQGGPEGPAFASAAGPRVEEVQRVFISGDDDLVGLAWEAGYYVVDDSLEADLVVMGEPLDVVHHARRPGAVCLVDASYGSVTLAGARARYPEQVVGYGGVPAVSQRQVVELAPGLQTRQEALDMAVRFFQSLKKDVEVVGDSPGLIAPRIIACLVNEASYAQMEGVASVRDIDTAMKLGVNYPQGPFTWADAVGPDKILRILKGLHRETGDDRYRPCPYLQRLVAAGASFTGGKGQKCVTS